VDTQEKTIAIGELNVIELLTEKKEEEILRLINMRFIKLIINALAEDLNLERQ
jgi:hypothetical protein